MSRGKTTVRAAVSLALLAGFYVYALAVAGALFGLGVLAFDVFGGLLSLKILLATGGAALAVFAGLAAALRRGAEREPGMLVSRSDAPALWEFVDDTARRVATRTADTLRLLPEVNAAVGEETGLLGLTGGRRTLYLGVPVAAGLSAGELRAILAHEFGHYAAVHTRLTALSHRGRMAIGHVVGRLRRRAPLVAWVFKPYTALYLAVQSAVSRGQEREADRVAVRIAGAEAAVGAFTGLHLLDLAVDRFLDTEVGCGRPFGLVPRGVWTGFGSYLDEHGTELRALAEETPYPGPGLFSTHPPVGERIAFFERAGGEPEAPDTGRARDLLPETLWASPELDALAVEPGDGEPLAWDEFGPTVFWAVQRNLADAGYRQIARVTGTPSLAAVLDQYGDAERARRWYRAYVDPAFPPGGMGGIVLTAAHEAGALTCRHRWGDWLVVRPDGTELDMEAYFDRVDVALADLRPEGAERLRALFAEVGVDPAAAVGGDTRADARTAVYSGLESNVSWDGSPHDMAVTDEGIVLLPCPKSTEGAHERLLAHARDHRPHELAALPGAVWVAYEEIAAAKAVRKVPLKYRLSLEDGSAHVLAHAFLCETVGDPDGPLSRRLALLERKAARQAD